MKNIFDIDKKSLKRLQNLFKESPKDFRVATAGVLNSLAFTTRKYDIDNITISLIVRNKGFLNRSIKVQTTRAVDINRQQSIVGTVARGNFTGWTEQQLGSRVKQKKAFTIPGRAGSARKQVPGRHRMKQGRKFLRSDSINPKITRYKNESHKTYIFMLMMGRRKKEPFIIDKPIGKMKPGLYIYKGKKLIFLASIDNIKQPKQVKFRSSSIRSLLVRNDIDKIWNQQIDRIVDKYK